MQVFKLFLQIINKNKVSVFMTLIIAFVFSIIFVKNNDSQFSIQKATIAIVDRDQSEASKALVANMQQMTDVKDIAEDKIETSLFYKEVEYVLYIPKGYEQQLKANQEVDLGKKQIPDSASAYIVDNYVQAFTNTLQNYVVFGNVSSMSEAIKLTNQDVTMAIDTEQIGSETASSIHYYFNFLCYSFFSSLIWGIGIVMVALNKVDIKRRNAISPVSNLKMNVQLSLGATVLGVILFALSVIFAFAFFDKDLQSIGSYLYFVNLLVLLFPCLGLAYLIGISIRKAEAINGISNILCLGLAFLGGCFVPQAILSESVLQISRFTPSYWFVNSNDRIATLTSLDMKFLTPIYQNMAILFGFGLLFFALAIGMSYYKRKNII